MNLAELAAYVHDVKPESDVHSNLPKSQVPSGIHKKTINETETNINKR